MLRLGGARLAVFSYAHEAWTCTFALVEHLHVDGVVVILELDGVCLQRSHDAWR